jgi:RNA polymerase sigma factor (TIGR02999 family)
LIWSPAICNNPDVNDHLDVDRAATTPAETRGPPSIRGREPQASVPPDDVEGAEELVAVLYETLRRLAHRKLAQEKRSPTLQPTELVHEAFLRLVQDPAFRWKNRRYVFGAAAEAIRRILVERARRRRRVRHGGLLERVPFESDLLPARHADSDFLALNQAIDRLESRDPRKAAIVKLRYLIGLTIEETAEVMDLSPATVKQDWFYSRAWLHREMFGSARRGDAGGAEAHRDRGRHLLK